MNGIQMIRKRILDQGSPSTREHFALLSVGFSAERAEYHAKNAMELALKDPHAKEIDFELKAYMNSLKDLYTIFFALKSIKGIPRLMEIVGAKDIPFNDHLQDLCVPGYMFSVGGEKAPKNGPYKISRGSHEVDFHLEKDHPKVMEEVADALAF